MSPSDLDTGIGQPRGIEDRVPRSHWIRFPKSPSSSRRLGVGDPGENVQFPAQNQFREASDVGVFDELEAFIMALPQNLKAMKML